MMSAVSMIKLVTKSLVTFIESLNFHVNMRIISKLCHH